MATSERAATVQLATGARVDLLAVGEPWPPALAGWRVATVSDAEEAAWALLRHRPRILLIGSRCPTSDAAAILEAAARLLAGEAPVVVAHGLRLPQGAGGSPRVAYAAPSSLGAADLQQLLEATLALETGRADRCPSPIPASPREAVELRRTSDLTHRVVASRSLREAGAALAAGLERLLGANGASLWLVGLGDQGAAPPGPGAREVGSPPEGLLGFVAATGAPLRLDDCRADPRFVQAIDDPEGLGPRWMAAAARSAATGVVTCVAVTRNEEALPFSPEELDLLHRFLSTVEARLIQLAAVRRAEAMLGDLAAPGLLQDVFREEAVEQYASGVIPQSDVLRLSSPVVEWGFRAVLVLVAASVLALLLGSVNDYASGSAVLRATDQVQVVATVGGILKELAVRPGAEVVPGQVLASLYDEPEAAELHRMEQEAEAATIRFLRAPGEPEPRTTLGALLAGRAAAKARRDERILRAPAAGLVADVWTRPGDHVEPGQRIVSILGEGTRFVLVAAMPGSSRPLLTPGMALRFEVAGYSRSAEWYPISRVGDNVVDGAEARHYLGHGPEAKASDGPVVIVEAVVPEGRFTFDGKTYRFHDGMRGTAEVSVRRERLLFALVPGLRRVTGD